MAGARWSGVLLAIAAAGVAGGATLRSQSASPAEVRGVEWAGRGVWLRSELHVHTRFSDGSQTVDDVVAAAARNGCDVVAITDHSDGGLKAATPEYLDAIRAARAAHPEIVVVAGLEWNVPPGKGQEHAGVLVPTELEQVAPLAEFKARFDDEDKKGENAPLALEALAWLQRVNGSGLAPMVTMHHPTRVPDSTSAPALTFEALHRAAPGIMSAVEGGPGHQKSDPLGSYKNPQSLIVRWDPIVAEVGGAWDQWLGKGLDIWGAAADADFHGPSGEFWPCEFSSTWVYAPDRSVNGIIRALHAGSYAGEQGHIVERPELQVHVEGVPQPVVAGQTLAVAAGTTVTATLSFTVPARDYERRPGRIDRVELIGIAEGKAAIISGGAPASPEAFSVPVTVPPGGIVLRARGRRGAIDRTSLMFYTNPIRIVAR
jgi:hypothetical protein